MSGITHSGASSSCSAPAGFRAEILPAKATFLPVVVTGVATADVLPSISWSGPCLLGVLGPFAGDESKFAVCFPAVVFTLVGFCACNPFSIRASILAYIFGGSGGRPCVLGNLSFDWSRLQAISAQA